MKRLILILYDTFHAHRGLMFTVLAVVTVVLGVLIHRISYKEDITDFLPLSGNDQEAMRMYQGLSGANRIIAIVGVKGAKSPDADRLCDAADAFVTSIDGEKLKTTYTIDLDKMSDVAAFVYRNIPYFLTDADYHRMDSLLRTHDYVGSQLNNDMEMLMFPSGSMLSDNIGRDPLNLFTPVVERLSSGSQSLNYELYNGHIFTPDMKNAVVIIESPYGSSETDRNGQLIDRLTDCSGKVEKQFPGVSIRLTGGPVIAVDNAGQIKSDTILSVSIAIVLILVLLAVAFRNVRNIGLVAVTIIWGWVFALGCLSIVHSTISLIVLGVSSIIIGIAVNYPLHLVAHLNHTPDMRQALREIVEPLLVGNITTIGAFLCLVPLKSVALRDLGLFAAFLLIGTILFVFAFLPHFVRVSAEPRTGWLTRLGNVQLENKRWIVVVTAVLTLIFGVLSLNTKFDSDISHINYLTKEQKSNLSYLSSLLRSNPKEKTVYAVADGRSADEALAANEKMQTALAQISRDKAVTGVHSPAQFLPSKAEQHRRLAMWNGFVDRYGKTIRDNLESAGASLGFGSGSFSDFYAILSKKYTVENIAHFAPLTDGPLRQNYYYYTSSDTYNIITPVTVRADRAGDVAAHLDKSLPCGYSFEIGALNKGIANSLSDNFNYIGWACGLIVFFFLWLSFGNIELAALSFLPMAVSWLWILGLMSLFGIQFNIINIILATFIFGQGDDYTIFITEGCQYEYAYGRKMLASYKNSIVISAIIMFIGMGVLVIARHPALRSLGEVTVVGMFSVVLMAYLLPPFIFKWITRKNGSLRRRPLTVRSLLMPRRYPDSCEAGRTHDYYARYVMDCYYYCGADIVRTVKTALRNHTATAVLSPNGTITVDGESYGAVALVEALMHPKATVIARTSDADDADVCRNVACRIAGNIRIESK